MNWFEKGNENEIKNEYRRLAKLHHPDLGGDTATMQEINLQYESALRGIYTGYGWDAEKTINVKNDGDKIGELRIGFDENDKSDK